MPVYEIMIVTRFLSTIEADGRWEAIDKAKEEAIEIMREKIDDEKAMKALLQVEDVEEY
ncbi:MAG: hypothetical protein ACXQS8_06435 [Candidatus Helarchaeales archaeon]